MKKWFIFSVIGGSCFVVMISFFNKPESKMKPALFNHFAIYVSDLEASARFYKTYFQLQEIEEPFKQGRHRWFSIGEHAQLHIIAGNTRKMEHIRDVHLAFSVQDLQELIVALDKGNIAYSNWQGTSKTPTVRPDGVQQIYLQDPDGYWLEVNNDQ